MVPPVFKLPVKLFTIVSVIVFANLFTFRAQAQLFTRGNLTVLKVGDGVAPLSSAAAQISVVEYTTSGVATTGIVTLPSTGAAKITNSGNDVTEGMMTLSAERDRLVIAGYDATGGTAGVAATAASANSREIFTIDHNGSFNKVAFSSTAYSTNNIRSATASGTNYLSAGPGATSGLMLLNSALQLTTAPADANVIQVFNGQTYFSSAASGFSGVSALGTGIPLTSGQTSTLVSPVSGSPYGFAISPDSSILYIADDVTGITKYARSGSAYITAYVVNATPVRGLSVDFSGAQPVLFATTTETSGNKIIQVADFGAGSSSAVLVTAPANTLFRGITFSPSCYAAIAVSGPATICSGGSTDVTISGNPSAIVTYNINGGAPATATIGVNGKVTVNTGALISNAVVNLVSITTPACSSVLLSGSANITVNPAPAAITGAASACIGLTTTLTESATGGTWSSSNGAVATVDAGGIVTGVSVGTSDISYVLPTTCFITRTVTVSTPPLAIAGTSILCAGNPTVLTDPTPGGSWSSSNSGIANIVTSTGYLLGIATVTSTATITYSIGSGCYALMDVTVNPSPVAITGTFNVCVGATTTVADATAGGSWSSSAPAKATIGSTGIITGVAAGTAIISYIVPAGCYAVKMITVNPLPAAITGPAIVCIGSVGTLHSATLGGTWSSTGASGIFTIGTTGVVTGVGVGSAAVSYKSAQGCYNSVIVTVNPAVTAIAGTGSICRLDTITLTDAATGGTWSSNNTYIAIAGSTTGKVYGWNTGIARISYSLSAACYATVVVTVLATPLPVMSGTSVCVASTMILTDASAGGSWSVSGPAGSISTTGILTGVSAGTVLVSYTLPTGCPATKLVTVNPLPATITGTMNICTGLTSTLASASTGGVWTSGLTSVAIVGATTGVVTGLTAGFAHITYSLPTGCKANTLITVNTSPAAITGTTNVCIGASPSMLSDATGAGLWTTSNAGVLIVAPGSGILTAVAAGTATISYNLSDGCFATHDVSVNITPLPVTGTMILCNAATTTLSNATPGGSWVASGVVATVGSSTGVVTGVASGVTNITYAMPSGCAALATVTVQAIPEPILGPTSLCFGAPGNLHDVSFPGSWSSSNTGVVTIGLASGILTTVAPGTSVITYMFPTGCNITSVFTVNPVPDPIAGTAAICAGVPLTLTDALTGGTWVSENTIIATVDTNAGVVTGIVNGTSKISYIMPSGCQATTIVTVKVTPSAIAGPSVLCNGSDIILANSGFGGIWTSSNTAVATIGTSSLASICNLIGVGAGTTVVTYTVGDCSATRLITVSPMPTAITGNAPLCQESTLPLTDSVAGGLWNSGDAAIASVAPSTGVVTGVAPGTIMMTYSINAVCLVTTVITVNPIAALARIAITPDGPLCANSLYQNVGANMPQPAGVTYQWSASNAEIVAQGADKQNTLVSFHSGGMAVIRLSSSLNGSACIRTDSFVTNVSVSVAPMPEIIYFQSNLVFLDNTADYYQWGYDDLTTYDSTIADGGRNQDYYLPTPDFGHVRYWAMSEHSGCVQKTYYYDPAHATNTVSNKNFDVSLYPNPTETTLNIEIAGLGKNETADVRVVDMPGKIIYTTTISGGKGNIDVSKFASGAYSVIILHNGAAVATRMFVKN